MTLELAVLRDAGEHPCPRDEEFQAWAGAALAGAGQRGALSLAIRIVDAQESRRLNREYRGQDRPTNVLSFPVDLPSELLGELSVRPLGDLAICAALVPTEASGQDKAEAHHWAHLVVHGVLHLLGYDHQAEDQAQRMETLEIEVLRKLGIDDPYRAA